MTVFIGLISNFIIEAEIIFVSSVIILCILDTTLFLSDLENINFEGAMILLKLVRFIANLPAEKSLR